MPSGQVLKGQDMAVDGTPTIRLLSQVASYASALESEEPGDGMSWSVRGPRAGATLTGPAPSGAGCDVLPVYRDLH